MSNNADGFVKMFRSSINSSVFIEAKYWQLWSYILMKASYRPSKFPFNGQDIDIPAGAFVTGRKALSRDINQTERNIRTGLNYLKSTNRISIKATNRFSIIQVVNWEKYQFSDQQTTSKRPTNDQQTTTNKNIKNIKNIKNNNMVDAGKEKESSFSFDMSLVDKYIDIKDKKGEIKTSKDRYRQSVIDNIRKDEECYHSLKKTVLREDEKCQRDEISNREVIIENGLREIEDSIISDVEDEVSKMGDEERIAIMKEAEERTKIDFNVNKISPILEKAVKGNLMEVYRKKIKSALFDRAKEEGYKVSSGISEIDMKSMVADFSRANRVTVEETKGLIESDVIRPFMSYFSLYYRDEASLEMLRTYYSSSNKNIKRR